MTYEEKASYALPAGVPKADVHEDLVYMFMFVLVAGVSVRVCIYTCV